MSASSLPAPASRGASMGGLETTIDLEVSNALLALSDLKRRQLPFATALALTRTAQAAQREIRAQLPSRFTIRNAYVERGVRIQAATKRRPQAVVFWRAPGGSARRSFAEALARQEEGGKKQPRARHLAIPRGVIRGAGGTITKAKRPEALLRQKRVYVTEVRGGAGIFQRVGKSRPRLLYFLTPRTARIEPRWAFKDTAQRVARRVYRREFGRAYARALATRRK